MALNFFGRRNPSRPAPVTPIENRVTDISSSASNQNNAEGSANSNQNITYNPYSNNYNLASSYNGFPSSGGMGVSNDTLAPASIVPSTAPVSVAAANDTYQPSSTVTAQVQSENSLGVATAVPSYAGFPPDPAGTTPSYGGFPGGGDTIPSYSGFPGGGGTPPSYGGFPPSGVTVEQQHRFDVAQSKSEDMMATPATPSYGGFPTSGMVMAANDTLASGAGTGAPSVNIPVTSESDVEKFVKELAVNPNADVKPPPGVTVKLMPGQPATVSFQGQNWTVYPVPTGGSSTPSPAPLPASVAIQHTQMASGAETQRDVNSGQTTVITPAGGIGSVANHDPYTGAATTAKPALAHPAPALSGAETQRDVNSGQTTIIAGGLDTTTGKLINPHLVGVANHDPYTGATDTKPAATHPVPALSGAETQRDVNSSQTTTISANLDARGNLKDAQYVGVANHDPYGDNKVSTTVPSTAASALDTRSAALNQEYGLGGSVHPTAPAAAPVNNFNAPSVATARAKSDDMFSAPASVTPPVTKGPTFTTPPAQHFGDVTAGSSLSALDPGNHIHHGRVSDL